MGLLTGTLIVLGSLMVIAGTGAAIHASTEDDRARAKIDQLEAENKQLYSAKEYVSTIKEKLVNAKKYLVEGKNYFFAGGYVLDAKVLANSEFDACMDKLDGAIKNSTNLITDFDATIANNEKVIKEERAKLGAIKSIGESASKGALKGAATARERTTITNATTQTTPPSTSTPTTQTPTSNTNITNNIDYNVTPNVNRGSERVKIEQNLRF